MLSELERLRQLFNEELDKLDEYRPNAFMLSRMEEKDKTDQDGDGDNDFDDVRIARRKASGMSKAAAIASVKRKPMGKSSGKEESDSLSESVSKLSLRERRAMHSAVKRKIIKESDGEVNPVWRSVTPGASSAASSEQSDAEKKLESLMGAPIDSTLSKGGKVLYTKTQGGWVSNVTATPNQFLALARPGVRGVIKTEIDNAREGDEISILKANLQNPNLANTSNDLTLVKSGNSFFDPRPLSRESLLLIMTKKDITFAAPATAAAGIPEATYSIGNVGFSIEENVVTITVPESRMLEGFNMLFGPSRNIGAEAQQARRDKKTGRPILKFSPDKVESGSILNALFPKKIGVFRFTPEEIGSNPVYVARITVLDPEGFKSRIKRLTGGR